MNPNPYEILQINPNADLEDIKKAYYYIAKIYHPDKGGDKQQFQILQNAFREILKLKKNQSSGQNNGPLQYQDLKQGYQSFDPTKYVQQTDYNPERFNQNFVQSRTDQDYVYGVNESDYVERTKQDFERENAQINGELQNFNRIFRKGHFDQNSFNHYFLYLKDQQGGCQDLAPANGPEPANSNALAVYTNLETRQDGPGNYFEAFAQAPQNPQNVDPGLIKKLSKKGANK